MKRSFAILTIFALLLSLALVPFSVGAAGVGSARFSAPSVTVRPGGTVDIPVSISGDYQAHGLNVWLVFDNSAITLTETVRGDVLSAINASGGLAILDSKVEDGKNSVRLGVIMPVDPFTAQGTLFTARLKVSESVAVGTELELELRVREFIYMPIGDHQGSAIPFTASNGRITVSTDASPTAAPTARPTTAPTSAPTTAPTSAPTSAPTARPTSAPTSTPTSRPTGTPTSSPTARPTSAPTSRPTSTPTSRPTAPSGATPAPTGGAHTVTPTPGGGSRINGSPDPNLTIDPYARFSMSPFPTDDPDNTPDGRATIDPYARFSQSPAPSTPAPFDTLPPFDTVPPTVPDLPDMPSRGSKTGLIAAVGGAAAAAVGIGAFLLISGKKRRKNDKE